MIEGQPNSNAENSIAAERDPQTITDTPSPQQCADRIENLLVTLFKHLGDSLNVTEPAEPKSEQILKEIRALRRGQNLCMAATSEI